MPNTTTLTVFWDNKSGEVSGLTLISESTARDSEKSLIRLLGKKRWKPSKKTVQATGERIVFSNDHDSLISFKVGTDLAGLIVRFFRQSKSGLKFELISDVCPHLEITKTGFSKDREEAFEMMRAYH